MQPQDLPIQQLTARIEALESNFSEEITLLKEQLQQLQNQQQEQPAAMEGQVDVWQQNSFDAPQEYYDAAEESYYAEQESYQQPSPAASTPPPSPAYAHNSNAATILPAWNNLAGSNQPYASAANQPVQPAASQAPASPLKRNLEKFIGENLISRIGALIMLIGVGFGVKYSLEHNLIGATGRIIASYIAAALMLYGSFKLKKKYHDLSAVTQSAAIGMFYFISYFAYDTYGLISRGLAFGLMSIFTVFTVVSALNYNKQVIAFIGMLAAYGIPLLVGGHSSNPAVLFGYVAIVNAGIFYISLKKHWQSLFATSMLLGWLVYFVWFAMSFNPRTQLPSALFSASLLYVLFLASQVCGRLAAKQQANRWDVIFYSLNTLLYFCAGYVLLNGIHPNRLGLYALFLACVHFGIAKILQHYRRQNIASYYLPMSNMLALLAVAVAVQLDGKWVCIFWSLQAAFMYRIGYLRGISFYRYPGCILLGCGGLNLIFNYPHLLYHQGFYLDTQISLFVFNSPYMSAVFFSLCCAACAYTYFSSSSKQVATQVESTWEKAFGLICTIMALLVFLVYSLREIWLYWQLRGIQSILVINDTNIANRDTGYFCTLWMLVFPLLFAAAIIAVLQYKKARKETIFPAVLIGCTSCLAYLLFGLPAMSSLNSSYAFPQELFPASGMHIAMRYVSLACFVLLLWQLWRLSRERLVLRRILEIASATALVIWLSCETSCLYDLAGWDNASKSGWTLIWSVCALLLVAIGIYLHEKHLRLAAMCLFGLTTIKVLLYDMASSNTLARTFAFVALGLLMLACSFLYNKFKHLIVDENTHRD